METLNRETSKAKGLHKPYQKPTVTQVKLIPNENILGGCRVSSSSGNISGNPMGCSAPYACIN